MLQNAGPSEFGRGRVFPQSLPPRRRHCVTGPARIHPRPHEIGSPSNIIIQHHVQAALYGSFENVKHAYANWTRVTAVRELLTEIYFADLIVRKHVVFGISVLNLSSFL